VQNVQEYQDLGADQLHVLLHKACLNSNKKFTAEELQDVLSDNTSEMLIMVDGLDEYMGTGKLKVLDQLLVPRSDQAEPWYRGCGLLVASRSIAAMIVEVRRESQRNYELLGFAPKQMREFVTKCLALNRSDGGGTHPPKKGSIIQMSSFPESSGEGADELLEAIDADVDLAAACQTAYTLAMVCAIFVQDSAKFDAEGGAKLTAIYSEITMLVAKGNVLRRGLFGETKNAVADCKKVLREKLSSELNKKMEAALDRVSHLALEVGFQANKHSAGADEGGGSGGGSRGAAFQTDFSEDSVAEIFGSQSGDVLQLGLVTKIECDDGDGGYYNARYTFPHLTIQEFMAARGIASGVVEGVTLLSCIDQHVDNPRWHVVLRFAVGLLRSGRKVQAIEAIEAIADHGTQLVKNISGEPIQGSMTVEPRIFSLCLQCVSESSVDGREDFLNAIKGLLMEKIDLGNAGITDVELGALAAVLPLLDGAEAGPKELILNNNGFGIEGVKRLATALKDKRITLTELQ
jgi:hypothetical protein